MKCKKCGSTEVIKNGVVRGKQRYYCKKCKHNFTVGDGRESQQLRVLRAALFIINSSGRLRGADQARLLNRDRAQIYRLNKAEENNYKAQKKTCVMEHWEYDRLRWYLSIEDFRFNPAEPVFAASAKMSDRDDEYSFVFIMQNRFNKSDRYPKADLRRTKAAVFILYKLNIISDEMSGQEFFRKLLSQYRPKDKETPPDGSVRDRYTSCLDYSEVGDYIEKNALLDPSVPILLSSETMYGGYLIFMMQRKSLIEK